MNFFSFSFVKCLEEEPVPKKTEPKSIIKQSPRVSDSEKSRESQKEQTKKSKKEEGKKFLFKI